MRFLALIGALAIIAAIGAAIYFFGGFFNVAESEDNPAIVDWALASVRGASVVAHGTETPPANLDDRRDGQSRRARLFDDRLRQLSRRTAERQLGQMVRRAEAGPRRSQGHGERAHRLATVLGDQERHQVHRHAELRSGRGVRSGPVVDRRFHQEAAERIGRRIQGLDGGSLAASLPQQLLEMRKQRRIRRRHRVGSQVLWPHPFQRLPIERPNEALPAAADVERHQEVEIVDTRGLRRSAARGSPL